MKFTNLLITILTACALLTACGDTDAPHDDDVDLVTTTSQNTAKATTTPKWVGTYFGVTPCASCPGINSLITLNEDGNYEKVDGYLESGEEPIKTSGRIKWNDDRSILIIAGDHYEWEGDRLYQLNNDLKRATGEQAGKYVLARTVLNPQPGQDFGYDTRTFRGDDGQQYQIVWHTKSDIPTARVTTTGFEEMLSRFREGDDDDDFLGGDTRLSVRGGDTILLVSGKQVRLTEKK